MNLDKRSISAPNAPQSSGGYAQAVETIGATRILHVSGQVPVAQDGTTPSEFGDQCRLVWTNLEAQLQAAEMTLDNLVKVTTFLSDRRYAAENGDIRRTVLAGRTVALTVIITGIYDEAWLLEVEAVAMA